MGKMGKRPYLKQSDKTKSELKTSNQPKKMNTRISITDAEALFGSTLPEFLRGSEWSEGKFVREIAARRHKMDRPQYDHLFHEAVVPGPEAISLSHASREGEAVDCGAPRF